MRGSHNPFHDTNGLLSQQTSRTASNGEEDQDRRPHRYFRCSSVLSREGKAPARPASLSGQVAVPVHAFVTQPVVAAFIEDDFHRPSRVVGIDLVDFFLVNVDDIDVLACGTHNPLLSPSKDLGNQRLTCHRVRSFIPNSTASYLIALSATGVPTVKVATGNCVTQCA